MHSRPSSSQSRLQHSEYLSSERVIMNHLHPIPVVPPRTSIHASTYPATQPPTWVRSRTQHPRTHPINHAPTYPYMHPHTQSLKEAPKHPPSSVQPHTHTHTHTRTRAHTRAHIHPPTHACTQFAWPLHVLRRQHTSYCCERYSWEPCIRLVPPRLYRDLLCC